MVLTLAFSPASGAPRRAAGTQQLGHPEEGCSGSLLSPWGCWGCWGTSVPSRVNSQWSPSWESGQFPALCLAVVLPGKGFGLSVWQDEGNLPFVLLLSLRVQKEGALFEGSHSLMASHSLAAPTRTLPRQGLVEPKGIAPR